MLVEWRLQALKSLEQIASYLAERNPYAAERIQADIEATAEALPQHPYIHRPGRVPGTREAVVHPNYILVYRVTYCIDVVDVLHARQEYPTH